MRAWAVGLLLAGSAACVGEIGTEHGPAYDSGPAPEVFVDAGVDAPPDVAPDTWLSPCETGPVLDGEYFDQANR
jgi:hypothetical protein